MDPKDREPQQRVFFNHYPVTDGFKASIDTLVLIPITNYGKYHLKGARLAEGAAATSLP